MIQTFGDTQTEEFFNGKRIKKFEPFEDVAQRKLAAIYAAADLRDLRIPPNNRLEKLKGKRKDFYSIRINDQWRICFKWKDGGAYEVEIEDYH